MREIDQARLCRRSRQKITCLFRLQVCDKDELFDRDYRVEYSDTAFIAATDNCNKSSKIRFAATGWRTGKTLFVNGEVSQLFSTLVWILSDYEMILSTWWAYQTMIWKRTTWPDMDRNDVGQYFILWRGTSQRFGSRQVAGVLAKWFVTYWQSMQTDHGLSFVCLNAASLIVSS